MGEAFEKARPATSLTWGNIINFVAIVIAFGVQWGVMQTQINMHQSAIETALRDRQALDVRLRGVESSSTRADERFNSMISLLNRIDQRQERMEQRVEQLVSERTP